ncbi:hypothetical protein Taro_045982 [Colocasia esculenta]|uniref:Uncharacterized protein n=1 Tax=Colocasia esculenta TaxID=4460 RepID=A0A843X3J0_COLES|nr:hypothetical protein [Colocasia esculenta]
MPDGLGQPTTAEAGGELPATAGEGNSRHPCLLPLFLSVSSTLPGISCRPHRLLPPPLQSGRLASPAARSPDLKDSLAGRGVRILNFSRQVVASGILMSDDNDNVVMGKKLGGLAQLTVEVDQKTEGIEDLGANEIAKEIRNDI